MENNIENDSALRYTAPDNRGICGFCGETEGGYAKRDENGKLQAACWDCVKPKVTTPQQKRNFVGTIYTDPEPEEVKAPAKKKNPGLAPSTHRPKVL